MPTLSQLGSAAGPDPVKAAHGQVAGAVGDDVYCLLQKIRSRGFALWLDQRESEDAHLPGPTTLGSMSRSNGSR